MFNSFFKGADMLFCLKDGDAFPTQDLGLPERLQVTPVEPTAEQLARADFERLCHAYPDGSFPSGEKRKPVCPGQGVGWEDLDGAKLIMPPAFPGEPLIPGSGDKEIPWLPAILFHRGRVGADAFIPAHSQFVQGLKSVKPDWSDLYQFLQTLRQLPSQ